uniref:Cytochrome n=1 Tax=Lutzomyia longipalpis TaxID=7200 RepID=A0A1B0CD19_LUTLO
MDDQISATIALAAKLQQITPQSLPRAPFCVILHNTALFSHCPNLKMVVLVILLAFVAFLCLITWWWQVSCSSYWRVRGVPYIAGFPFIGALRGVVFFQKSVTELFLQLYNDAETKNEPIVGFYFFHKPSLLIRDPELIKRILVKDFNNFPDRFVVCVHA